LFNDGPTWLQKTYTKYGENFAKLIKRRSAVKSSIKFFMDMAIKNSNVKNEYAENEVKNYMFEKNSK
jgi:hypothetical protein